jgi:alpha-ketoglutarate-dependent sulfate ester dioxygenase
MTTTATHGDQGGSAEWYGSLDHPTPSIGVALHDVDPTALQNAETHDAVEWLLRTRRVVFLRGLKPLEAHAFEAFAEQFGPLGRHVKSADTQGPSALLTQDGLPNNHWHTDGTYQELPPKYVMLQAHVVPTVGGDTLWANTVSAYRSLPEELRTLAAGLRVRHSNAWWRWASGRSNDYQTLEAVHPLVQYIADTEEQSLLLGEHAVYIEGFARADSAALIELFQRQITAPEHTVRWRWQPGDVAIWDGRTTQHYAAADYRGHSRIMRRVWVASV